jgi:tRNA A37 threonylcarbamoyladenosine dehydratase
VGGEANPEIINDNVVLIAAPLAPFPNCVVSFRKNDEQEVITSSEGKVKKSLIGTNSYMPAVFGFAVTSVVIRDLLAKAR